MGVDSRSIRPSFVRNYTPRAHAKLQVELAKWDRKGLRQAKVPTIFTEGEPPSRVGCHELL